MSTDPETVDTQIEMENRAHAIRLKMLGNPGFMQALREGIAADKADEMIPLEELDRELGWDR